jgi:GNAT superfamily N-acetyltransferase
VGIGFLLEAGESTEIFGLVVDHMARRNGLGRQLIAAAERWSRARGFDRIVVRSNVVRTESRRFDPALGFVPFKARRVHLKPLVARPERERSGRPARSVPIPSAIELSSD